MQTSIGGKPCTIHAKSGTIDFEQGQVVRFHSPEDLATHLAHVHPNRRIIWMLMCEYDNIDPDEKIVVFTDNNPYEPSYETLYQTRLNHHEKYGSCNRQ